MASCSLTNLTFADLQLETKKPPVTTVSPEDSISQALEFMKSKDSVIVPIRTRSGGPESIAAIVGVADILAYIIKNAGGQASGWQNVDLEKEKIEQVETLGLGETEEESYRIWERDFRDTLNATLLAFARGIHRALITDALDQKRAYILTQTDITRYVNAHPDSVTPAVDLDAPISQSLKDALTYQKHVITMRDHQSAFDGFALMKEKGVAALPVVDGSGSIVGILSASDVRGITKTGLGKLEMPVLEYLKQKSSAGKVRQPILCTPNDSLRHIISTLVEQDVHRIFIVAQKDDLRPIGVVSQSDIIGAFIHVRAQ
ncbi:hypothetical protein BC832DRAFT_591589 [Gaertneriomyces semiglobifer]|nr:hypothetical protein BC832DRAFT_591589 [Gaertneriomyces semiglobifer]